MIRTKRPRRKSRHQELVQEADAWVKAIVMQRSGEKCMRGGPHPQIHCGGPLQACHILRKGGMYASLRYELENVIIMCRDHHLFWAHVDEHAFYQWIEQIYPGRIEKLKQASMQRRKIDVKELICVLKAIHANEK